MATRQGSIGFEWLFSAYTAQKNPEIREYDRIFYVCLNKKYLSSKLLCTLKCLILDEVQGKKTDKPRGFFVFLTQKFAKSECFRAKLPYLVVALSQSF